MPRSLLVTILAALGGCNPNGPLVDGVACMEADPDAACPSIDEAEAALLGDHCTVIVERITGEGTHGETSIYGDTGGMETVPACCYPTRERQETGCVDGRPLRVAGVPTIAPVTRGPGWADDARAGGILPDDARAALADAWATAAAYEHASVAAFAKLVLELLAFGAPADLVAEAQRAAGDEIAHAQALFGLASAWAGAPIGPGPLPVPATLDRHVDLATFAADAVREGCVGETIAAATMAACAAAAVDPATAATLARIADDEARHAALSWRLVQWAIAAGGAPVAAAVDAAFAEALAGAIHVEGGVTRDDLGAFGRIGPAAQAAVVAETVRGVIGPARGALRAA